MLNERGDMRNKNFEAPTKSSERKKSCNFNLKRKLKVQKNEEGILRVCRVK